MYTKTTSRHQIIADIAFAATITAIILVMIIVPWTGFIPIGPFAITILHIPVLIGAILLGKYYGLFFGIVFGLGSMIRSFIEISLYAPFTNPLVSVLTRAIFGFVITFIYMGFKKLIKNKTVAVGLTMGVSTLIHSTLVLVAYYFVVKTGFYPGASEYIFAINEGFFKFFLAALGINGLLEIAAAIIIGTAITIPLLIQREKFIQSVSY
jgi:uncharacterized membrane protein